MKRFLAGFGAAIVTLLLSAGIPLVNSVATVANLTALQGTPISAGYSGIIYRMTDGVAGAPPMTFATGSGTCASIGMNNDGASCVNENTGNHWLGIFSAAGVDVRQWGAVSGGVTDAFAALNAAFNSGVKVPLIVPGATFRSTAQLTLPDNGILQGSDYRPGSVVAGSNIQCDNTVAGACLVLGTGINAPNIVRDLVISHGNGVLNATAECLNIPGGLQTHVEHVECFNSVNGFESDFKPANGAGLFNYYDHIITCKLSGYHVIVNAAPGMYYDHPQLGCDGAVDVAGLGYVLIKGNWDATMGTVHFTDPHFNLGQNVVTCAVNFAGFTGTTNQFLDFNITGGHVEAATNFLCSDSTAKSIAQLVIQGNSTTGGTHFFALNAATEPEFWSFTNNIGLAWTDYVLAPAAGPAVFNMSGNQFPGLLHITAASGGNAVITDNVYIGGATIDGAGWQVGQFSGTFLGGAPSFSNSALLNLNVNLNSLACTPALQIGGSSAGITYSAGTPFCSATLANHYLTMNYDLSVTSLGGLTGVASMTGLPFMTPAFGTPITPAIYLNMAGLSGGVLAEVGVSSHSALFVTNSATNLVQLTNTNFGACSGGSPCVLQGIVTFPVAGN